MKPLAPLFGALYLCASSTAAEIEVEGRSANSVSSFTAPGTPPPCAQTSFPIANGGFEDGNFDSWSLGSQPEMVGIVSPGRNSAYAAKLTAAPDPSYLTYSGVLYACPWRLYNLEFDYMIPETVGTCYFNPIVTSSPTGYLSVPIVQSPWTHTSLSFSTTETRSIRLQTSISCEDDNLNATIIVDNFSITPRPETLENPGCPRQMSIDNGGFEAGSLANWNIPPRMFTPKCVNYSIVSPGRGPNSRYMFQADFHQPQQEFILLTLARNISNFCVGYNYTYSWSYRFEGFNYLQHPNFCSFKFTDHNCLTPIGNYEAYGPTYEAWTHANFTCEAATSGVHNVNFAIFCGNGEPPNYNYTKFSFMFDDVAVALDPIQTAPATP